MKIGLVYPQVEFGSDPGAIRDYVQTAEELGYTHILAYDHVLGANPDRPDRLTGPYTHQSPFLEPLVLFSYMSAFANRLEFATGVLILPQRQTALVAKQAATLDILCGGRLRLGVGLGWNHVEYTALGMDFRTRGRRIEEQIEVLRLLWTQPLVTYRGRWHTIPDAGIQPLPVQRPIPIWMGGTAEAAIRRIARLADGWMINIRSVEDARPAVELLHRALEEVGRDPARFGLEARLPYGDGSPDTWIKAIQGWEELGATHLSINTMGPGFTGPGEHISAVRKFAETTAFVH
jgi:probable F420-dependent oxidoreductase